VVSNFFTLIFKQGLNLSKAKWRYYHTGRVLTPVTSEVVSLKTYENENSFKEYKYQQHNYLNSNPSVLSFTQNHWVNPITSTCTRADRYCRGFPLFSVSSIANLLLYFTGSSF
jgi:hypothetical protein